MKKRAIIFASILFAYFSGSAPAYLKHYPPYKFQDGPPVHLKVDALVDSIKSEYSSEDGRILAHLKKTKSGMNILIKEDELALISKTVQGFPVPYAVYRADIDGNGLMDFIVFYNYRDWFRDGIKEDKVEIILKKEAGVYKKITYDAISAGLEDFVDLDHNGTYEVIVTHMNRIRKRTYFTYSIYEIVDLKLSNSDAKFDGFSKFVRYILRPHDDDDPDISSEQRAIYIDKKNSAIQYSDIAKNKNPVVANPEKNLEERVRDLAEQLTLKDEVIQALDARNEQLRVEFEGKNKAFQRVLAIQEKAHQKALAVKGDEFSEMLYQKEQELIAVEEREEELKVALEAKERELQNVIASKESNLQEMQTVKVKEIDEINSREMETKKALEERVRALTATLSQKEAELQVTGEKLQKALESRESDSVTASQKGESAKAYEAQLKELQGTIDQQNKELTRLKGEIKKHKVTLEAKEKELQDATAAHQLTDSKRKLAEEKVSELTENLLANAIKLGRLIDEEKKLKVALSVKETELKEVITLGGEGSNKQYNAQISKLNKALGQRDEDLAILQEEKKKQIAALEAKIRELTKSIADKDGELKELQETLTLKDEVVTFLQEKEQMLITQLESKKRTLRETVATGNRERKDAVEPRAKVEVEKRASTAFMPEEEPSIKIGVVDVQRVIEESRKGVEARRYFEGLIALRSEDELGDVEQQLISEIMKDIEALVKEYAEEEGFTFIKDKLEGGIIYNEDIFDITDEIIELYDSKVKRL